MRSPFSEEVHLKVSAGSALMDGPTATVALVGPPNCGKSTLFNRLTGLRQKTANFPGVTVERHHGTVGLSDGRELEILDLPGTYSLTPRSEDERITDDLLRGKMPEVCIPDAVLLVLDSTNLGRHLVLAAPMLALEKPILVILNMADELRRRGGEVDVDALSGRLGAPVVLVSAAKGEGLDGISQFLESTFRAPEPVGLPVLQSPPSCRQWAGQVAAESAYRPPVAPVWTRRLDRLFLHPFLGPLVFLMVVLAVFQTIFNAAVPLMDAVEALITGSGSWLEGALPDSALKDLVVEGVWGGVGSVLVFLPQILLLFLFLGVLEDSGYLARAAVIADRTMAKVGLQGKSFIPLLSAYACAVPAVMATRTIENKRDRLATILIAPFMTCAARLPVYILVIAAFMENRPLLGPFLGTRAAALLGLYLLGFLAALVTAVILKSTILKSDRTPFVMELPPYRWPTAKSLGLRLLDRSKIFLRRAGTVILSVAVGLWILAHLPLVDGQAPEIGESLAGTMGRTIEPIIEPLGFDWKIGVGLVTSLAAREVIVGTLGTLNGIDGDENSGGLQEALRQDLDLGGAVALLVFFAFAMQCMSTVAMVRRETGGWRIPILQFTYMGVLAYVAAFAANQLVTWLV
ncbi:MAG: ferrous iron transporter B [Gemmatimonadetes bacterium]|nr:ferrous iron transporter B [Gemmatimonadota bacterium]NNM06174.1 ferrous iron transporter B [Gemmatimonadota bacterium]